MRHFNEIKRIFILFNFLISSFAFGAATGVPASAGISPLQAALEQVRALSSENVEMLLRGQLALVREMLPFFDGGEEEVELAKALLEAESREDAEDFAKTCETSLGELGREVAFFVDLVENPTSYTIGNLYEWGIRVFSRYDKSFRILLLDVAASEEAGRYHPVDYPPVQRLQELLRNAGFIGEGDEESVAYSPHEIRAWELRICWLLIRSFHKSTVAGKSLNVKASDIDSLFYEAFYKKMDLNGALKAFVEGKTESVPPLEEYVSLTPVGKEKVETSRLFINVRRHGRKMILKQGGDRLKESLTAWDRIVTAVAYDHFLPTAQTTKRGGRKSRSLNKPPGLIKVLREVGSVATRRPDKRKLRQATGFLLGKVDTLELPEVVAHGGKYKPKGRVNTLPVVATLAARRKDSELLAEERRDQEALDVVLELNRQAHAMKAAKKTTAGGASASAAGAAGGDTAAVVDKEEAAVFGGGASAAAAAGGGAADERISLSGLANGHNVLKFATLVLDPNGAAINGRAILAGLRSIRRLLGEKCKLEQASGSRVKFFHPLLGETKTYHLHKNMIHMDARNVFREVLKTLFNCEGI